MKLELSRGPVSLVINYSIFYHHASLFFQNVHWTDLVKSKFGENALNSLTDKERKRFEALWELFHAEVVYIIDHLLVLKEVCSVILFFHALNALFLYAMGIY